MTPLVLFRSFRRPFICRECPLWRSALSLTAICAAIVLLSPPRAVAGPVRDGAAVSITFDDAKPDGSFPVTAGEQEVLGRAMNGAATEASPFWAQRDRRALRLDAAAKQFVRLDDAPVLDHSEAVSLSFFFLNLHKLNEDAFHGIVAKRADDGGRTNFGINYRPKNDALQVYVNDGGEFRVAVYSVRGVLGYRRLVHLTATFEVTDAPAAVEPDSQSPAQQRNDVRIRLFANGKQVKPAKVTQGTVAGSDAWVLDVNPSGLPNDAPLTIGSSTPGSEYTSCLIDEFLLFARALTPDEAGELFHEVAGPNADDLARRETDAAPPAPAITALSLAGLQLGTTTRLAITGRGLAANPRVELPLKNFQQKIVAGSNANRLIVDLTLPADAQPGYFPLRVLTDSGVSGALPIAVDDLPQRPAAEATREQPASLPAAFSGTVSGSQRAQVYFRGTKGQRIVGEVEARRLGALLEPVLEIKTARGTPLAIEWAKVYLGGDARAEVILPADGLYYAELHDLAYKAPGRNPFRIVLGDLELVDGFFPPAVPRGAAVRVEPIGSGIPLRTTVEANVPTDASGRSAWISPPAGSKLRRALNPIRISDAVEVVESAPSDGSPQRIDARFASNKHRATIINGRISQSNEEDRYLLDVTPGQSLSLRVDARSIDSPLDAQLAVRLGGATQIVRDDRPGSRDPELTYKVPKEVKQIELSVRDLYGRGGEQFLYRLRVIPAGQPDFSLRITTARLALPADGTALVELELNPGGYNGAVKLTTEGVSGVTLSPQEISAGGGNRKLLITVKRKRTAAPAGLEQLRIIGESIGLPQPIRRPAILAEEAGRVVLRGFEDVLPVASAPPLGVELHVAQTPPALLKALTGTVSVEVARSGDGPRHPVRLTLISTEADRPADPKNAGKGNKLKVRAAPDQFIPADANAGQLNILVPADVAEKSIEFVIRGDVLMHPYSDRVLGTVYSDPFRLPVQDAVKVTIDAKTLNLLGETENKVTGTVRRAKSLEGNIVLAIKGLPSGYSAPQVTLPPEAETFEITVTAPKENEKRPLNRITFTVTDPTGRALEPVRNLKVTVSPKRAGK